MSRVTAPFLTMTSPRSARGHAPLRALLVLAGFVCFAQAASAPGRMDLDVAMPPGSPLDWTRGIPTTPSRPGPTVPITPSGAGHEVEPSQGGSRTVASGGDQGTLQVRLPTTFSVLRILTWDLPAHIPWIGQNDQKEHTLTQAGDGASYPPVVSRPFFWITIAPLLRWMLHPAKVSHAELLAHLLELGEPALPALRAASEERSVRDDCAWLIAKIGNPPTSRPRHRTAGKTPYEKMLHAFAVEELVTGHPFDPDMTFARRLKLLGSPLIDVVADYTTDGHDFLRRNAVAMLGTYPDASALGPLMKVVEDSKDLVTRIRAITALGRRRYTPATPALAARLTSGVDEIEGVALMYALGWIGDERGVPAILRYASGRERDGDVVLAALAALARTPLREHVNRAEDWIAKVARLANGARWASESEVDPMLSPDVPDSKGARADLIAQLALLARIRVDPANRSLQSAILKLGGRLRRTDEDVRRARAAFRNDSLGEVEAFHQYVYVDVLQAMGDAGAAKLEQIARDATADPALRGYALQAMRGEARLELAERLAADRREQRVVRIFAFEVLAQLSSRRAEPLAREFLGPFFAGRGSIDDIEEQYLYLVCLQALGRSYHNDAKNLVAALERMGSADADISPKDREALRSLIDELVDRASRGEPMARLAKRVEELVDFAILKRFHPNLVPARRTQLIQNVTNQLEQVRQGGAAGGIQKEIGATAIEGNLLGRPQPTAWTGQVEFRPVVPLMSTVVLELGRTRDPVAVLALARILRDAKHPYRAEAALALGSTGSRSAVTHLLAGLEDADGFVRMCAYEALKALTRQDHFADWWSGGQTERTAAVDAYRAWLTGTKK